MEDEILKGKVRTIHVTDEFDSFYESLDLKVRKKVDYVLMYIRNSKLLKADVVKKLVNTEFYELRVEMGTNAYRVIIFSVNHDNIQEATEILLLNGFLKKSTKDYKKQIERAVRIMNKFEL